MWKEKNMLLVSCPQAFAAAAAQVEIWAGWETDWIPRAVDVFLAKVSQDQSNQIFTFLSKQCVVPLALWQFTDGEGRLEQAVRQEWGKPQGNKAHLKLDQMERREHVWLTCVLFICSVEIPQTLQMKEPYVQVPHAYLRLSGQKTLFELNLITLTLTL